MKNTYQKGAVGVIVIILILLAGAVGFYFYNTNKADDAREGMMIEDESSEVNEINDTDESVGFEEEPTNLPITPKGGSTTPPAGDAPSGGTNGSQVENPNIPVVTEEPVIGASVGMKGFTFSPKTVTIKAGESVEWTNDDYSGHTVTSQITGGFDSGNLASGNTYVQKFTEPGTYTYYCRYHPNMTGTIIVE